MTNSRWYTTGLSHDCWDDKTRFAVTSKPVNPGTWLRSDDIVLALRYDDAWDLGLDDKSVGELLRHIVNLHNDSVDRDAGLR